MAERLQSLTPTGPNQRFLHFHLPDSLTAAPQSAVCLYFQLPNQKVLPVRKAGPQVTDTIRMRYDAWEKTAAGNAQQKSYDVQTAALKRALEAKNAELEADEKVLRDRGWQSVDACQNIAVPKFGGGERPFDVVDPAQQEEVARRICVSRIKWASEWLDEDIKGEDPTKKKAEYQKQVLEKVVLNPEQLTAVLHAAGQKLEGPEFRQRSEQLREFRTDWARWAADAASYRPQLGTRGRIDYTELQSFLIESCDTDPEACDRLAYLIASSSGHAALFSRQPSANNSMVLGYVGGALEAYSRCVVDDQKELKTKYDAWTQLQSESPMLQQEARKELLVSCQRQFATVERARADKASLEGQLQQQVSVKATDTQGVISGSQDLNASVCQRPQ